MVQQVVEVGLHMAPPTVGVHWSPFEHPEWDMVVPVAQDTQLVVDRGAVRSSRMELTGLSHHQICLYKVIYWQIIMKVHN